MRSGWKSRNFATNIQYIRPEKASDHSSAYELFMKYSFFGLLTALFSLVVLTGCITPSKEIVVIEESMGSGVDLEKYTGLLPLSEFEPPQETDGENVKP